MQAERRRSFTRPHNRICCASESRIGHVSHIARDNTFLQNLGKVDRTADDIFDEHLQNFMRQQNAANRLQKEFNNYIRCVRAVQAASKTLMDSLNEIYESQWTGHDLLYVQAQNLDMLWQDFTHKLADQVLVPLNTYQSQFPEMRKKIDKRGRKLVDYDSQRHNFQSLQCNPRKRDELKVSRGKELLEEAKRTYEQLNSELHDELPALYDSRVLFLVTNLQTLFAAEQVFHTESAKVYSELEAIVDKLANESQRGSYTLKKSTEPQSPKSPNANSALIINTQPAQNNISPDVEYENGTNFSLGATTDNLPPGVLYRVKATYKYRREDVDELSFDVGDIIRVVEYDDPEEQEQGWLMGIKEDTNEKGMFPANFTKPL
ncbi:myc box-dependent-interacting protein 1 isoform X4 [Bombus vosnesenskii]|uniref:Myc box-dependent-interacting protein 1 isoform X4 n=1 Tax=Bombus vosnesenskii TaxID=207650 RepID=A0A6J3LMG3_9HYME|nr:myc box-dependent-interacting protein 1 isoform X4 [Bombus vosnesenskii]